MSSDVRRKVLSVRECLKRFGSVLVAYSGGVDSTLLLKFCLQTLGDRVLAVTAGSPVLASRDLSTVAEIAWSLSARHLVIELDLLGNPRFTSNPPDRCYHCKADLFTSLKGVAAERGIFHILDGSNFDDLEDYRPGARAAGECSVKSPLQEAGLTKAEIRNLARELNLPNWDKAPEPCLASRFPYGVAITERALRQVEQGEKLLRDMGLGQVRLRHYGDLAKIEVGAREIPSLLDGSRREEIVGRLKDLGYHQITVDLEGYRTGSMNEGLIRELRSA